MLEGLRTVVYAVADLDAARAWYTDLLGHGPYFDEPFYVGFSVGGYELGLMPAEGGTDTSSTTYWGVPDADAAYEALLARGGSPKAPVEEVGGGIRLDAVTDPFGNVLGVIYNPHFTLPPSEQMRSLLEVKPKTAEDGQARYEVTLSLDLNDVQYEEQTCLAAQHAKMSETEYLQKCLIYGIEKGLG